jgi:hypothetical protein
MHFHIVNMHKDKKDNNNVKNMFLSMCDVTLFLIQFNRASAYAGIFAPFALSKGNNKITELRTILQRESQNVHRLYLYNLV